MDHGLVEARPAPIELDLLTAAVVVVDKQNDFASDGGMFDRVGIDVSSIQAIPDCPRSCPRSLSASRLEQTLRNAEFVPGWCAPLPGLAPVGA